MVPGGAVTFTSTAKVSPTVTSVLEATASATTGGGEAAAAATTNMPNNT